MLILGRKEWQEWLACEDGQAQLALLYGGAEGICERYLAAFDDYRQSFGHEVGAFFSAPGRTELSGNHTDHQHGVVLAGAVTLDMLAVVHPRNDMKIRLVSAGYPTTELALEVLVPLADEKNTTAALARGIVAGLIERGHQAGGFDAYISSQVPRGSGLSSSAAIELLLATIQNVLYNNGAVDPVTLAKIGQYAENRFFGKPSGLLDQTSIALGGVSFIDFSGSDIRYKRLDADFRALGYELCVVNAGGTHDGLTGEYAAIPGEMKAVAAAFGKTVLGEVDEMVFYGAIPALRSLVSDRAILRTVHFYTENARVPQQLAALQSGDIEAYRRLMQASGRSSYEYLQNIYPSGDEAERSVSLALCLSERILSDRGAWRVHGGGFAGTIQALVPLDLLEQYTAQMQAMFGKSSVYRLRIRPFGGYCFAQN